MTRFPNVSQADIDAGIARGRQLRSRYLAEKAGGLADALARALIRHYRGREISRQLEQLPDYLLKDIGLERAQIPAVAGGNLTRPKSSLAEAVCRRIGGIFDRRPAPAATTANDHRSLAA